MITFQNKKTLIFPARRKTLPEADLPNIFQATMQAGKTNRLIMSSGVWFPGLDLQKVKSTGNDQIFP